MKYKNRESEQQAVEQEVNTYKEQLEQEIITREGSSEGDVDSSELYKPPQFAPETPDCSTAGAGPVGQGGSGIRTSYGVIPNYLDGEGLPDADKSEADKDTAVKGNVKKETVVKSEVLDDEGFSDIDDAEIESLILKPIEIAIKRRRWNESDYDEFLEEKARKKKEKEEEERTKPKRKYKKSQRSINASKGVSKTPGEAMEKMIKEKKLSTKINYEVLKKLGSECDAAIDRVRRDTEPSNERARKRIKSDRSRHDTIESNFDDYADTVEEDDYFDYPENLALNDAMHSYSAEEDP